MKKIRKNVFETNSSSSHSLAFSKKDRGYSYDLPVDEDGVLTIPFGEFGWGPDVLRTPLEKLSYYVTDNCPNVDEEKVWDDIIEELKEDEDIKKAIDAVMFNCPQVKEITFAPASSFYPLGYVDHQSCGTSHEDGIDVERLIFDNDVIIIIDNDNSCHFENYWCSAYGRNIEQLFDEE